MFNQEKSRLWLEGGRGHCGLGVQSMRSRTTLPVHILLSDQLSLVTWGKLLNRFGSQISHSKMEIR